MKKLKKLTINPENLMNNEELINLRGGYGSSSVTVCCTCTGSGSSLGYILAVNYSECKEACGDVYPDSTGPIYNMECY